MAKFETQFGIGDTIYLITDTLDLNVGLDSDEIFEEAIECIRKKEIKAITFSGIYTEYSFDDGSSISSEHKLINMFATLKEAYEFVMNKAIKDAKDATLSFESVLGNTKDNFDQVYNEYVNE